MKTIKYLTLMLIFVAMGKTAFAGCNEFCCQSGCAGETEAFTAVGCSSVFDETGPTEAASDSQMQMNAQEKCPNGQAVLISDIKRSIGRCRGFANMPFSKGTFVCSEK